VICGFGGVRISLSYPKRGCVQTPGRLRYPLLFFTLRNPQFPSFSEARHVSFEILSASLSDHFAIPSALSISQHPASTMIPQVLRQFCNHRSDSSPPPPYSLLPDTSLGPYNGPPSSTIIPSELKVRKLARSILVKPTRDAPLVDALHDPTPHIPRMKKFLFHCLAIMHGVSPTPPLNTPDWHYFFHLGRFVRAVSFHTKQYPSRPGMPPGGWDPLVSQSYNVFWREPLCSLLGADADTNDQILRLLYMHLESGYRAYGSGPHGLYGDEVTIKPLCVSSTPRMAESASKAASYEETENSSRSRPKSATASQEGQTLLDVFSREGKFAALAEYLDIRTIMIDRVAPPDGKYATAREQLMLMMRRIQEVYFDEYVRGEDGKALWWTLSGHAKRQRSQFAKSRYIART
jgi:hypothetical protein